MAVIKMGKRRELSGGVAVFPVIPRQTRWLHDICPSFQAGGVRLAINQGNN